MVAFDKASSQKHSAFSQFVAYGIDTWRIGAKLLTTRVLRAGIDIILGITVFDA